MAQPDAGSQRVYRGIIVEYQGRKDGWMLDHSNENWDINNMSSEYSCDMPMLDTLEEWKDKIDAYLGNSSRVREPFIDYPVLPKKRKKSQPKLKDSEIAILIHAVNFYSEEELLSPKLRDGIIKKLEKIRKSQR